MRHMLSASNRLAQGYTSMLVHAFAHRGLLGDPAIRDALWRQIHFTGVRALPYAALVALLFGAVVVTRVLALVGDDNEAVLKTIVGGGLRELGPLVTALIVIVRSSVAIAAEVALMQLRGELSETLRSAATHEDEVVLPRVLGVAIGSTLLVACFEFVAIASAMTTTVFTLDSTFAAELDDFLIAATWWQVPLSLAKGAMFGAGIAAISCYHGLQVEREIGEIPKAVVAACAGSLTFVIGVDVAAFALKLV
jgi:phospholipid/cholesterol/gamma-HCH transport system permease protein